MSGERLMHDPWERRPPRRRHLGEAAPLVPGVPVAPVEVVAVPPVEAADPDIVPDPE